MDTPHTPNAFYLDRTGRGHLRLTGRDRQSFLQGMVSNDVAKLAPGGGCYAFLLDATGHILSDARIFCAEDALHLDVEPGMAPFVAQTLEKYLIMERCKISDVTGETAQVLVYGDHAPALLETVFGVSGLADWTEGQNAAATFQNAPVLIAATRLTGGSAFDVYVAPDALPGVIDALAGYGAAQGSGETVEALRIEAGAPRFGADMDARVLAPETGQEARAISYRKGCYIGQEIVARIHARGHTNRGLVGFTFAPNVADAPAPDAPVQDAATTKDAGRVTSAAWSERQGRVVALGYVRREFMEPGTPVTVTGAGAATVVAAPSQAGNGSSS